MVRVTYCGNVWDCSGYAEAGRNNIAALLDCGVEVSLPPPRCRDAGATLGPAQAQLLRSLVSIGDRHTARVIHCVPDRFRDHIQPGVKNIGCTVWETDKAPASWVAACNVMDEIWVPCRWNVDVFRSCGVVVPIRLVPHTFRPEWADRSGAALDLQEVPPKSFVFYSIFQWTERKNPVGLIKAYLSEFTRRDEVCLLIKTYVSDHSERERLELQRRIAVLRRELGMESDPIPPVVLLVQNLAREQMVSLHRRGDCYVLPHRSEGWGVPLMEAMAFAKPTIATGFGGNLEFMRPRNSYLIDHQLTPVCGMPWVKVYRGDQMWAEPDLGHLKRLMRHVYQNRGEAEGKGGRAANDMQAFSPQRVGGLMKRLLGG